MRPLRQYRCSCCCGSFRAALARIHAGGCAEGVPSGGPPLGGILQALGEPLRGEGRLGLARVGGVWGGQVGRWRPSAPTRRKVVAPAVRKEARTGRKTEKAAPGPERTGSSWRRFARAGGGHYGSPLARGLRRPLAFARGRLVTVNALAEIRVSLHRGRWNSDAGRMRPLATVREELVGTVIRG